jgi:hypothetical protein
MMGLPNQMMMYPVYQNPYNYPSAPSGIFLLLFFIALILLILFCTYAFLAIMEDIFIAQLLYFYSSNCHHNHHNHHDHHYHQIPTTSPLAPVPAKALRLILNHLNTIPNPDTCNIRICHTTRTRIFKTQIVIISITRPRI